MRWGGSRSDYRVLPDTAGFRRDLQRAVDAAEAGLEVEIPVNFDVDPEELREKLAGIHAQLNVNVGFDVDPEELRAKLAALEASRVTVPVDLGDGTEIERLKARLEELDSKDITISVELRGVLQATAQLEYLFSLVSLLDGKRINMQVDVDGLGAAVAQLGSLSALSSTAGGKLSAAARAGTREFGRLDSGIRNVATGLAQAVVLAPALAVAGAGVTAAWGAISTAILAIPAAIALVGVPLGLLLLDFDSLKESIAKATPEFQKFRKAASDALAKGLGPALEKFATAVLPKIQTGVSRVATTMGTLAQRSVDWLATTQGVSALNAMLSNVDRTLQSMSRGLGDLGQTFLLLAGQDTAFDVLSAAVNEFGASFKSHVVDLIQSGTLDTAMRGLRDMLIELGQGFSDLVNNGIKLFAAAAPGVNQFLDSLSGFFNRFNWNSLGTSVGRVFSGLAESLGSVDDQTIRDIEQAFSDLADVFQDPKFQDNLTKIIDGIPGAVRTFGELTRAFGEVGAAISGVISFIDQLNAKFAPFIQGINDNIDKLRRKMAEENGLDPEDPFGLKLLDDNPEGFFTVLFLGLETAFARAKLIVTAGMAALGQLMNWDAIKVTAQIAWALIPTYISLGFAAMQIAATTGMGLLETALSLGWERMKLAASLAWAVLPTYITIGFTAMQIAATTGMTLLETSLSLGWERMKLAASLAWALMPTYITLGFAAMQVAATTGVALVETAVSTGWERIKLLTGLAWNQVSTIVGLAWGIITGNTQTGATTTETTTTSAWTNIQAATAGAWPAIQQIVADAFNQIVAVVQTGAATVVSEMQALPGRITSALGNLGSLLVAQGRALMDGLLAGIKAAAEAVYAYVSSIAGRIAALKGPKSYDRRVLRPNGQWLMDGLQTGIEDGFTVIQRLVATFARTLGALQFEAPQLANVGSFVTAGQTIGEGLENGLLAHRDSIIAAARSLTDGINTELGKVDATTATGAFDNIAASVHDQVRRSAVEVNSTLGGAPTAEKQVVIQTTINNPLPETGSDSVAKVQRRQAAMGIFG